MDQPFLRTKRQRRLGLGIEIDAEAVAVQVADGFSQLREASTRGVTVVAREERSLAQLLDCDLGRSDVGVSEAEVDDVFAPTPELELQPLDFSERVGRKCVDSAEVHHQSSCPDAMVTASELSGWSTVPH